MVALVTGLSASSSGQDIAAAVKTLEPNAGRKEEAGSTRSHLLACLPEACYTALMAEVTLRTAQLSGKELCRLGQAIYDRDLKRKLEPAHDGEHVVIHVANGDYAVDPDEYRAYTAMREKYPKDVFFFARVGSDAGEELPTPFQA